ncbi:MAG: CHAT domain-containing protein [Cyanobacteriota bacterium]|nr:CHAT domain-containing protein [Cyanobacteriota bacterium]
MHAYFKSFNFSAAVLLFWMASPQLSPDFKFFEPAVVRSQTLQDRRVEEFRLYGEGIEQFEQNRYREAIQKFEQALAIAREMDDKDRKGRTLQYIGFVYYTLEEYPLALEFYQEAIAAYRAIGNGEIDDDSVYKNNEASLLNNMGSVYANLGDNESALQFQQQALEIAKQTGNLATQRTTLNNIGQSHVRLGDYGLALDFFQQALEMRDRVVDNSGAGVEQYNIGSVYLKLGDYDLALKFFEQALARLRRLNNKAGEVRTLNTIGNVYSKREEYETALDYYQQALAIAKNLDQPSLEGATLSNMGTVRREQEDYNSALELYQQALEIYQQIGSISGESVILDNMGEAYFHLEQDKAALAHYQQALAINREGGNKARQGENLSNIAYLYERQNRPELAILFFKQALNIREEIRQNITSLSPELQQSYTETIADDYRALADLLQQDRLLEAQRVLDLLKVQELNDYLKNVRGNANTTRGISNSPPEQQIWSNYTDLSDRAIELGQELTQLRQQTNRTPQQEGRIVELVGAQQEILGQFNAFIDSPEVQSNLDQLSRTAQRQNIALEDLNALQDNLSQLDQNAVLLYPFILEDRLELILVTPDSPPIRRSVEVSREELNAAIVEFRRALQNPSVNAQRRAQRLYNWLIKPIEADLAAAEVETLIYAPDGQLRYIPLAALYDGEQWLVERFRINNITSASLTDLNRQPRSQQRILAGAFANVSYPVTVGDKEFFFQALPFAGTEVENLAKIVSETTSLVDNAFTRDRIIPQMDNYTTVHLATHGAVVVGSPQDSFILFGDGQIATLDEIKNWSLKNVDLVVLSACETGVGSRFGTGEEILGLGYQFQRAGARATIASLWSVDDGGTQRLMNGFYGALQQEGMTKAEALRQAQIALITGDYSMVGGGQRVGTETSLENLDLEVEQRLSHPFYWAPFILIGNGL